MHARTLEIYARLGIAGHALELGKRAGAADMWARGRRMARVPLGDIGRDLSPFPYVLMLGQDDNEHIMGAKLNELGVEVQWNTELTALEQSPGHATATLKLPDGTARKLTAAWVAGCDGARSAVRELSGIGFPGAPYEHVFFVADTVATGSMFPDELNVYLLEDGFHLFFPMRGHDHWRIVGILPPHLRGRDDLTFEEVIPSLRREATTELSFKSCSWFSTYRIHHRAAERFRDRRAFLLGDAAHIHSPVGGQGMNTGIQDAYNLAWKLALVTQGGAPETLLESYGEERLPVAQQLLATTDRLFTVVVSDSRIAAIFRTRIMARILTFAMSIERIRRLAFLTISQIGIRYPRSALSQTLAGAPAHGPQAGDRFPWMRLAFQPGGAIEDVFERFGDLRCNLLIAGQAAGAVPAESENLGIHVVPADPRNDAELARHGIRAPAFYLLRPDGHVGLAGGTLDLEAARAYLAKFRCGREGRAARGCCS